MKLNTDLCGDSSRSRNGHNQSAWHKVFDAVVEPRSINVENNIIQYPHYTDMIYHAWSGLNASTAAPPHSIPHLAFNPFAYPALPAAHAMQVILVTDPSAQRLQNRGSLMARALVKPGRPERINDG